MARSTTRLTAVVVGLLALGVLGGCSDGGDPAASKTSTPRPSTSPITEPSPSAPAKGIVIAPEPPGAMAEDGASGAAAAAVFFVELDGYMQSTGDISTWKEMSHPECAFCADRQQQAEEIQRRGDIFTGGAIRAEVTETYQQDPVTGIWPLDLSVTQNAATVTDAAGTVIAELPYGELHQRVEVARQGGRWVIIGIGDAPQ